PRRSSDLIDFAHIDPAPLRYVQILNLEICEWSVQKRFLYSLVNGWPRPIFPDSENRLQTGTDQTAHVKNRCQYHHWINPVDNRYRSSCPAARHTSHPASVDLERLKSVVQSVD